MSGSMSSPLMLAMLANGSGGSQTGMDPSYAAALPRLQLAQSMIGEGTQTTPVQSPKYGGLARLAQALVGSYALDKATSGLQQAYGQANNAFNDQVGQVYPSGAPAAPALATAPAPAPAVQPATPGVAPPALANAVHQLETSGSNAPGITGDGGAAAGPMQVHQGALDDVNKAQGTTYTFAQLSADPTLGQKVGDAYLAQQQARFPGRPDLALAAYNAGPTATANAVASGAGLAGLPPSTQQYVQKGLALAGQPVGAPGGAQAAAPVEAAAAATDPEAHYQAGMALARQAAASPYPWISRQAPMLVEMANQALQHGSVRVGPNGVQTNAITGAQTGAAAPNANYQETAPGSGIFVDTTATHPPNYKPPGRITFNPVTGQGYESSPSGPNPLPPTDLAAAAALKSAQSQGSATGTQAAATIPKMTALGREADTAIGNIDYGINQLHQAAAGGINTGYFAPWVATAAAAGNSLGIDIKKLGVDPTAVGNIQSAQKTLGVVSGAILQNAIGKDSAITDAKIQHFIHTQPGIETDPQAIQRVLGWARSQFVYNRSMAMDAMQHADPNTGMIPPGWEPQYYAKRGAFAPIYDPLHGEMAQPTGQGPQPMMPEVPAPPQANAAPASPAVPAPGGAPPIDRATWEAEMRRRGLLK